MLYFKDENKLKRFHIEYDEDSESPRDWDNVGTMVMYWNRYNLGDKYMKSAAELRDYLSSLVCENVSDQDIVSFASSEGIEMPSDSDEAADFARESLTPIQEINVLNKYGDMCVVLIHAYEHGGITISTSYSYPYSDRFDGGTAGFIYVDRKKFMSWYSHFELFESEGVIPVTEENWKECASKVLNAEVEVYDLYLRGDVYGYIEETLFDGIWSETDSCWGYYPCDLNCDHEEDIFKDVYGDIPFEKDIAKIA